MTDNQIVVAPKDAVPTSDTSIPEFVGDPEKLERMKALYESFAAIVSTKKRVTDKIETMQRARQAAQTDANAAREKWREMLRESDGTLTREIQKLRAAERSALALVEEYEALAIDIAKHLPRLELDAAEAAAACIAAQDSVVSNAASQAYKQALDKATESLALAMQLHYWEENAGLSYYNSKKKNETDLSFFTMLRNNVNERTCGDEVRRRAASYVGLPRLNLEGVDEKLLNSPALRHKTREQLNAKTEQ